MGRAWARDTADSTRGHKGQRVTLGYSGRAGLKADRCRSNEDSEARFPANISEGMDRGKSGRLDQRFGLPTTSLSEAMAERV